jgi:hypothetical protein
MKFKNYVSYIILLVSILILFSCNTKNNFKNTLLVFPNIHEQRVIITGKDTLNLYEFEFYHLMKFKNYDFGLGEYLEFEIQDTIQSYKVTFENNSSEKDTIVHINSPFRNISFDSFTNEFRVIEKNKFILTLHTNNQKKIKRKISTGVTYKVLFSFNVDSNTLRDNLATEYHSGYEIIDIVELDQPFYRQTEY